MGSEAVFDGENGEKRTCWSLQGAMIVCECDHCHSCIKMRERQVNCASHVLLHTDTTNLLEKVLHEEQIKRECVRKTLYILHG